MAVCRCLLRRCERIFLSTDSSVVAKSPSKKTSDFTITARGALAAFPLSKRRCFFCCNCRLQVLHSRDLLCRKVLRGRRPVAFWPSRLLAPPPAAV